jgi:hypothetical protein
MTTVLLKASPEAIRLQCGGFWVWLPIAAGVARVSAPARRMGLLLKQ